MKVGVDENRCRGHGVCLTICPEVFDLSDDGYATVASPEVPGEYEAAVLDAVANCPEKAISAG